MAMIVVADPDRGFHAQIAGHLGHQAEILDVWSLDQLERTLTERRERATVALLGPNLTGADTLRTAAWAQTAAPEVSIILVTSTLTSDLLTSALRAGVRDVLPASVGSQQLLEAVNRAGDLSRQLRSRGGDAPQQVQQDTSGHKVLTVFSAKGGCGKSFIASNLAVLLAQRSGEQVALVDLDLEFGDLAIMLQLFPARTIQDAAQNLDRLDADAMRGYLTPHRTKVGLLAAPVEPGLAETISAESVHAIIRFLRQSYPYVVIDSPATFTDHVLAALDETDECILVTSMDVPSIKNLKLSLQTLELLRFGRNRIRIVLNRADSKVGLTVHEVEKTLGTSVDVAIPSSIKVPLSINRGSPLAVEDPRSSVVAALSKLAHLSAIPSSASAPKAAPAARVSLDRVAEQPPTSRFRIGRR
jgi:pilus assembly protein CpaE